ncbi:hypothetical protein [Embleya sp. NBC_00888]|uniref:hypothetical protein n=1 Tax=Embleya sp. NBC_00888 TaxID=2975960 RepID=UPI00386E45F8
MTSTFETPLYAGDGRMAAVVHAAPAPPRRARRDVRPLHDRPGALRRLQRRRGLCLRDRYMAGSDEALTVPPGGWVQLTRDIREHKHSLTDVARTLRAWSRPRTD